MRLRVKFSILLGLAVGYCAPRASAQVVEVGGIDSTLFNATGGSVRMYLPHTESLVSAGMIDNHIVVGLSEAMTIHGVDVLAGDQFLNSSLSSDFIGTGYGFASRGISIHHQREKECSDAPRPAATQSPAGYVGTHCSGHDLFAFIGRSGIAYGLPVLPTTTVKRGNWLGLFRYERPLGEKFTFSTLEVAAEQGSTAIQSLTWQPRSDLRIATSGGVGANAPYAAVMLAFQRRRATLRVAYGAAGRDFRPVAIPEQLTISNSGLNAQGIVQPTHWLTLSGGHVQYAAPRKNGSTLHSIVDDAEMSLRFGKIELHQSVFRGTSGGIRTTGAAAGGYIELGRVMAQSNWYKASSREAMWLHALTFRVNQRLTVTQYISQTHDKISASWGGSYAGNRLVVSVGYSEQFFPVAGQNQNPFHSVLSVSVSTHVKDANVTIATVETPGQQTKWTAFGSSFLYGPYDTNGRHGKKFIGGNYLISGSVVTTTGEKVQGAAILLTDKKGRAAVVYSDSQGHFEQRVRKAEEFIVTVSLDEFTSQEIYKVVECPAKVVAVKDGQGETLHIIVTRQ